MPTLPSPSLAMDGENYLHPEGPQLDSSMFEVASSNMEELLARSSFSDPEEQRHEFYVSFCFLGIVLTAVWRLQRTLPYAIWKPAIPLE
ncbi:uncharacterized protein ACWYII_006881 isoform 2-T2 [Salvelinus alpinus]